MVILGDILMYVSQTISETWSLNKLTEQTAPCYGWKASLHLTLISARRPTRLVGDSQVSSTWRLVHTDVNVSRGSSFTPHCSINANNVLLLQIWLADQLLCHTNRSYVLDGYRNVLLGASNCSTISQRYCQSHTIDNRRCAHRWRPRN